MCSGVGEIDARNTRYVPDDAASLRIDDPDSPEEWTLLQQSMKFRLRAFPVQQVNCFNIFFFFLIQVDNFIEQCKRNDDHDASEDKADEPGPVVRLAGKPHPA